MHTSGELDFLGVIDISEGQIRWVNIVNSYYGTEFGGSHRYWTVFVVPDRRIWGSALRVRVMSKKRGEYVRWKGKDCGSGLKGRLEGASSIRDLVTARDDHEIEAHPKHGCWTISVRTWNDWIPPSKPAWTHYQTLAGHLLDTPIVTGE